MAAFARMFSGEAKAADFLFFWFFGVQVFRG